MNIIFLGDIVGKLGRKMVAKTLPALKKKYKADLVIANAENAAHGSGISLDIAHELRSAGLDAMTMGDHSFRHRKDLSLYDLPYMVRPANFSAQAPGRGFTVLETKKGRVLIINLIGQVMMKQDHQNPFWEINQMLANNDLHPKNFSAIIVDMHAEATSEKVAMRHHLDGRASAVLGTHTHIQTADAGITAKGTAYITDAGMCGATGECLGISKEGVLRTYLTQIKEPHVLPEAGPAELDGVFLKIDPKTSKALGIVTIREFRKIDG
jgi:hypothetical protein